MKKILLLCSMIVATQVFAGPMVYKCPGPDGKIQYQQTACTSSEGTEMSIATGSPSNVRKATEQEETDCLNAIRRSYNYKDPESLRVENGVYVNEYPSGRKEVLMMLNAKNSFGGYVGAKPAKCNYRASGDLRDVIAF